MKRLVTCCLLVVILALTAVVSACGEPVQQTPDMVTVTITLPGGVSYDGYVKEQSVESGAVIALPDDDELTGIPAGKKVDGWYIAEEKISGTNVTVTEDTEITLKLKDIPAPDEITVTITLPDGVSYDGYVKEQSVEVGTTITLPENGELTGIPAGKEVDGWYIGNQKITGNSVVVSEDTEITLKLKDIQTSKEVTVTLQGATLNGQTEMKVEKGGTIDLSAAVFSAQPENTYLRYWYNVSQPSQIFEDAAAIPADGDITLAPGFDLKQELYANRDGSTQGKLATYPYYGAADFVPGQPQQPEDGYIRAYDVSGEQVADPYWGYVGTGDSREMGAVYHWRGTDGALANGFYFTPLSPYKVQSGYKYVITYTVQNQGGQPITLKIYQVNSGSSPKNGVSSEEIALAAGEAKQITLEFSYGNNNILTTVELLSDGITDLKVGLYQYIALPKTSFTLTVINGTADGTVASKEVEMNTAVAPVPDELEGKNFYRWYNTQNPEETFEAEFVMPGHDLTIAPLYDGIYADIGSSEVSGGTGKVPIYPDNSGVWRNTPAKLKCSASLQNITDDEVWAVYNVTKEDGTINNGDYAMFQSKYGYQQANTYNTTFTVKNLGDETISLQFYITGSGSAWEGGVQTDNTAKAEVVLTLKPGETGTVDIDFNLKNNGSEMVIFQYVGETELSSLNIAMYQYINQITPVA